MKDLEFADWAFENDVTDDMLCKAARKIEAGLIDARLGGFLIKKRVAARGRSKAETIGRSLAIGRRIASFLSTALQRTNRKISQRPKRKRCKTLYRLYAAGRQAAFRWSKTS